MDPKDIRTLKLFEELDKDHTPSQRDLARSLGVSLGLVNSFLKRLISKGYFKVATIPQNRVRYILTPKGAAEKTRLTYEYIKRSYNFYREIRQRLRNLFGELENSEVQRIVIYGATDLGEVAYLSLQETSLTFCAFVDDFKIGKKIFNFTIKNPQELLRMNFDCIFIAAIESRALIHNNLIDMGIPESKFIDTQWNYKKS